MKKEKPFNEIKKEILREQADERDGRSSRRTFLTKLGVGAVVAALGGQAYAVLRSLVPNVLYEPDKRFKAGAPDKFTEGGNFLEDKRVFIFRNQNTYHAISAACTHLGCTVKMQKMSSPKKVTAGGKEIEELVEFHCPCHGSKYYGDGTNYAGPAPRPLDHFKIEVSPEDGQLVVDMAEKVGQDYRLTI
jgi:cytochrome b6-f complex iron-sulfur subunit